MVPKIFFWSSGAVQKWAFGSGNIQRGYRAKPKGRENGFRCSFTFGLLSKTVQKLENGVWNPFKEYQHDAEHHCPGKDRPIPENVRYNSSFQQKSTSVWCGYIITKRNEEIDLGYPLCLHARTQRPKWRSTLITIWLLNKCLYSSYLVRKTDLKTLLWIMPSI